MLFSKVTIFSCVWETYTSPEIKSRREKPKLSTSPVFNFFIDSDKTSSWLFASVSTPLTFAELEMSRVIFLGVGVFEEDCLLLRGTPQVEQTTGFLLSAQQFEQFINSVPCFQEYGPVLHSQLEVNLHQNI